MSITKLTREEFEVIAAIKPVADRARAALQVLESRFTQRPAGGPPAEAPKSGAQRTREYRERLRAKKG